jgi:hypothetical protein
MFKRLREIESNRYGSQGTTGMSKATLQLQTMIQECFKELTPEDGLCSLFVLPRIQSDNPHKLMENLYSAPVSSSELQFEKFLQLIRDTDKLRPVFIMGKVGIGKSTLVKYIFSCHKWPDGDDLVPVCVDFKKANSQISDLSGFVIDQIDRALEDELKTKELTSEERDSLTKKVLFTSNPAAQSYLENLRQLDAREGAIALTKALLHISEDRMLWNRARIHYLQRQRKRELFLIFDNLDHHLASHFIQKAITEGLRQSNSNQCKLIITLRPNNFGIAYELRPYAAEPMPLVLLIGIDIRQMLKQRINQVQQKYATEKYEAFTLSNNMRINAGDYLGLLARRLEALLTDPVLELLHGIAGRNYRRTLLAIRQVFSLKILTQPEEAGRSVLSKYDVLECLLRPTDDFYTSPEANPNVLLINIFENEQPEQAGNNLIRVRVLQAVNHHGNRALHRLVLDDLEKLGYPPLQVEPVLELLHAQGLIEGGDHSDILFSVDNRVYCHQLTESGHYYLDTLIYEFRYVLAVREDTMLPEEEYARIAKARGGREDRLEDRADAVLAFDDFLAEMEKQEAQKCTQAEILKDVFPRVTEKMKRSHEEAIGRLSHSHHRKVVGTSAEAHHEKSGD